MCARSNSGHYLVEFALVGSVFFLVLFAIVDFAAMFFVNLTMLQAVRAGTRYAVTGASDQGKDRRSALIQVVRDKSCGLYDRNLHTPKDPQVSVINPSRAALPDYQGTLAPEDPGGPNEVIVVSLTYTWPMLTPVMTPFFPNGYTFTVKSTMKNESFSTH